MMAVMTTQPGILVVGPSEHAFLTYRLKGEEQAEGALKALAGLLTQEPTTAGTAVVVGVRPSIWAAHAASEDVPEGVEDFTEPIVGPDGFTMPATQTDLWAWIQGGDRSTIFDATVATTKALAPFATPVEETIGWAYREHRDLTGFIDGTENPKAGIAPAVVGVPAGEPGAGSAVLLYQLWAHDVVDWAEQGTKRQEYVMGRTKTDSIELEPDVMPATSHVSRTTVKVDGEEFQIFRRNVAYGTPSDHGTVFVGFCAKQWTLAEMLRRMAGVGDGVRDDLTRFTTPLTGEYFVIPALEALVKLSPVADDDD